MKTERGRPPRRRLPSPSSWIACEAAVRRSARRGPDAPPAVGSLLRRPSRGPSAGVGSSAFVSAFFVVGLRSRRRLLLGLLLRLRAAGQHQTETQQPSNRQLLHFPTSCILTWVHEPGGNLSRPVPLRYLTLGIYSRGRYNFVGRSPIFLVDGAGIIGLFWPLRGWAGNGRRSRRDRDGTAGGRPPPGGISVCLPPDAARRPTRKT